MDTVYYLKNGSNVFIRNSMQMDFTESLLPATYTVKFDEMKGEFFLTQIENFSPIGKVYGSTESHKNRIFQTFESRPGSTGVLLSGEKGSGKTLLVKELSLLMRERGYPTIIINEDHCGDLFNTFIQSINTPALIVFDEFEKVYDNPAQERLLTLLDGAFPTKKLFALTCNDMFRTNNLLKNRPGRIFYHIQYQGLSPEFIVEYCKDVLHEDKHEHIDQIVSLSSLFTSFNFDMLKAIVEEMNRYNETPQSAMEILNAKPEDGNTSKFNVRAYYDGKDITEALHGGYRQVTVNPINAMFSVYFDDDHEIFNDLTIQYHQQFNSEQLVAYDVRSGEYTFKNGKLEIALVKVISSKFDIWNAI